MGRSTSGTQLNLSRTTPNPRYAAARSRVLLSAGMVLATGVQRPKRHVCVRRLA